MLYEHRGVCVCVCVCVVYSLVELRGQLVGVGSVFYRVGPRDAQDIRLGSKHIYLLRQFPGPVVLLNFKFYPTCSLPDIGEHLAFASL